MSNKKHIIVGLSGGVDSSVAAFLLKEQGYRVSAVFMKNWQAEAGQNCQASVDFADASKVCDTLQIELHSINCAQEYWAKVFSHFLAAYRAGHTPNPDILCNKEIKFTVFMEYAKQLGASHIATGHYAQIRLVDEQFQLLKAWDRTKDQSYFLYALNQHQLSNAIFPLGAMLKTDVRKLAKSLGLSTHDKKDSVGICFIGERNFKQFLSEYLPSQPGEIVNTTGDIIGKHDGLIFYTIGQRKGLHIGGHNKYLPEPWYVAAKDLANNRLIVAQRQQAILYHSILQAKDIHWINTPPSLPLHCTAKIRYQQAEQACTVTRLNTEIYQVVFTVPQQAVTAGQSVVFYQHDVCLGGGIII
jgi:tRNA-specific 2-thiouridylase